MTISNQHSDRLKKRLAKQGRSLSTTLAFIAFIAIVLGVFIVLKGGSKEPSTNTTSSHAMAQQDLDWFSKYDSVFTSTTNDISSLSKASNNSELEATCTQILKDSVQGEYKTPPIPDAALNSSLSSALNNFIDGAQKCQSGASNENANDISQATTDFQNGEAELNTTFDLIIHGKV
jgi:hypothetical protein